MNPFKFPKVIKISRIYVDGSLRNGKAGYGIYYGENDPRNKSVPLSNVDKNPFRKRCNNRAELHAVNHALRWTAKKLKKGIVTEPINIYTDSTSAIRSTKGGTTKVAANLKLFISNTALTNHINKQYQSRGWGSIGILHVKAHSGNPGNNAAHKLAQQDNPLLPFAYSISSLHDVSPLDTTPRDKLTIDENASSLYHTRKTVSPSPLKYKSRPMLVRKSVPTLKRKMGESFNDKDDVKRVDTGFDEQDQEEEGENVSIPLPPSSPPPALFTDDVPLVSEFDFTSNPETAYNIPNSPSTKQILNFPSELNDTTAYSSPTKKKPLSSEPDFGIDKFNRFNGTLTNDLSSSTGFEEQERSDQTSKQLAYNRARDVILTAFEDMETVINLEGMRLYELPPEIKDMNNLVVFDDEEPKSYQLYLNNNYLSHLPPALFKYTKLEVLSLRVNRLTSIPPSIEKLTNLVDLSLGANLLKFLPFQVLKLTNLVNFRAGPNMFKSPTDYQSDQIIEINRNVGPHVLVSRTVVFYRETPNTYLPSLKSLCLSTIARHDVSYQETKSWKKYTPKLYHSVIKKAITKGKYNDVCYKCSNIVVEPLAEVYEWWNILLNRGVPIRKQFCSQKCVDGYEKEVDF
ncbi:scrib Protein lap4 [Candida maltosa Xu316]